MDPQSELPEQGALAQVIKQTKKKKRRHKLKLSAKQKLIEKLDKASVALLKNDEKTNVLLVTIASWLEKRESSIHNILYKQCEKAQLQDLLNDFNDEDDDEDEEPVKEEKPPEKLEELPPLNDDDDINFEELMRTANKYVDSSENLNTQPETPAVTIDYKMLYDDFKIVVADLDIPCSSVGLHTICKLLDPQDTGEFDYRAFTSKNILSHIRHKHIDCIRFIVGTERPSKSASLDFKKEIPKHFVTKYPLYVKFDIKFAVFATEKDYRGHIKNEIIYSHMKVYSLKEMIKQRFDIATNSMYLFNETATAKIYLDDKKSLEEYGFVGDSDYNKVLNDPKKQVLFYDYEVGNPDPIIHCDYYFIKE